MAKKNPAVPSDLPVGLRNWCYSISKNLENVSGGGGSEDGSSSDFMARSDLSDLTKVVGQYGGLLGNGNKNIDYRTVPPPPRTLVYGTFGDNIALNWTYPDEYHALLIHKRTRIFRTEAYKQPWTTMPSAADIEVGELIPIGLITPSTDIQYLVGHSETRRYAEEVGYNRKYYYWIQFESLGGVLGIVSDVILGETTESISKRMRDNDDFINHLGLSQGLRSTINSTQTGGTLPTTKQDGTSLQIGDLWISDEGNVWVYLNTPLETSGVCVATASGDVISELDTEYDCNTNMNAALGLPGIYEREWQSYHGWVEKTIATDMDVVTLEVAEQLTPYALDDIAVIWYSDTEPTMTSHPKLSVDDIWVDTGSGTTILEGETEETKLPARYKLYTYTGDPLAWVEIVNEDLTKALSDAANAQSTADGKIQFFTGADDPNPRGDDDIPLGAGDLWLKPATATSVSVLKYWNGSSWADSGISTTDFVAAKVQTEVTELVGYCRSPTADAVTGEFPIWTDYTSKAACEATTVGGVWEDNGALAQKLSTVHTTVGDNYTTLTTDVQSADGKSGKYAVKMDSNGVVSGFGLSNSWSDKDPGVTQSSFVINADNFALLGKNANGTLATNAADKFNPFSVTRDKDVNGNSLDSYTTYINSALIDYAEIKDLTVEGLANLNRVNIAGGAISNVDANGDLYTDENGVQTGKVTMTNLEVDGAQVVNDITSKDFNEGNETGWQIRSDGSAFFGNDTTVSGTLVSIAIRGDVKVEDARFSYHMPQVTKIVVEHPGMSLDMTWFWDAAPWGLMRDNTVFRRLTSWNGYSKGYNGNWWGTIDHPHAYSTIGAVHGPYTMWYYKYGRDFPFGLYRNPVLSWPNYSRPAISGVTSTGKYEDTTSTSWDNNTIGEVSSNMWFGTSGELPEGNRIKSSSPIIKITAVGSGQIIGIGNGGGGFLDLNTTIPFTIHIRYATLLDGVYSGNSGWMEFPRGIAERLGGTYTGLTWNAPSELSGNTVFILGTSTRQSDYAEEFSYGTNIGFGAIVSDFYANAFSLGPRIPRSKVSPSVQLSVEVANQ